MAKLKGWFLRDLLKISKPIERENLFKYRNEKLTDSCSPVGLRLLAIGLGFHERI